MTKFISQRNSFKSGILSEKLFGRSDIAEYQHALSKGDNALISTQGGAYKRPCLTNVLQLPDNQDDIQLESATLFGNLTVFIVFSKFPVPQGTFINFDVLDSRGNLIYEGSYSTAGEIGTFQVAVFENKLIIVSGKGDAAPRYITLELSRGLTGTRQLRVTNDTSLGTNLFQRPLTDFNTDDSKKVVLKTASDLNTTNVTIESIGGWDITQEWEEGDYVIIEGASKFEQESKLGSNAYFILEFVGTTIAKVLPRFIFTGQVSPNNYDYMFNLTAGFQMGLTSPEYVQWASTQWSDSKGWPRSVSIDEGRVVFGGTDSYPATIWGSQIGNPFFFIDKRFKEPSASAVNWKVTYAGDIQDVDPYNFTLSTSRGAEISFMQSSVSFMVGTSRQELVISGDGSTISQKNISVRPHTSHGSAKNISAVVYDNTTLYVSRSRRQLFLFKWNEENGSFISKEVSLLNPDLFIDDRIKKLDWYEELGTAFIVMDSGKVNTLSLNNETATTAFTELPTDGFIQDVAYGIDDETEEGYMMFAVKRNGSVFLEKLSDEPISTRFSGYSSEEEDRPNFLDGAVTISKSVILKERVTKVDTTFNYFWGNYTSLKLDDEVVFSSTNPYGFINHGFDLELIAYTADDTSYTLTQLLTFDGIKTRDTVVSDYNIANPLITITHQGTVPEGLLVPQAQTVIISGGSTLDTGVTYFVRPFKDAEGRIGFKVGASAGAAFPIDLDPSAISPFDVVTADFTKTPQVIPTEHFANGTIVTYIGSLGGNVTEGTFTVSGITEDLGVDYDIVTYGIPYDFHIATAPIEVGQQGNSSQLGLKRVDKAGVRYYNTRSFEIGTNEDNLENVNTRDNLGLKTIGRKEVALQASSEFDQVIHIKNNKVEPCYISSLTLKGVSNDG